MTSAHGPNVGAHSHFSHTFTVGLDRHTLHINCRGYDIEQYDHLNSKEHKTRILTFDRLIGPILGYFVLNYQK